MKQWKKPKTIYDNLNKLNKMLKINMDEEKIYRCANTRKGLYAQCHGNTISFLLTPKVLSMPNKKEGRPGLVDPLTYYLGCL